MKHASCPSLMILLAYDNIKCLTSLRIVSSIAKTCDYDKKINIQCECEHANASLGAMSKKKAVIH